MRCSSCTGSCPSTRTSTAPCSNVGAWAAGVVAGGADAPHSAHVRQEGDSKREEGQPGPVQPDWEAGDVQRESWKMKEYPQRKLVDLRVVSGRRMMGRDYMVLMRTQDKFQS